jgi:acyl-CoA thioesterase
VASGLSVDFVAAAREGDVLTAQASETNRAARMGVYDITVSNQRGERVAFVRGRSYAVRGKTSVDLPVAPS